MKIIEHELAELKKNIGEMWDLVHKQISRASEALLTNNKDLAHEVLAMERRVNAYELKIDSDCEDVIALYAPVAVDLRFVLAVLKVNTNLERLGDFAEGIARFVVRHSDHGAMEQEMIEKTRLREMIGTVLEMFELTKQAMEQENTELATKVFSKDNIVDEINISSIEILNNYIQKDPSLGLTALYLVGVIRKLERFGDHCTNIAEEIIFYVDAKVLKHKGKKYNSPDLVEEKPQEEGAKQA